jgi:hypothetical protein
MNRFLSRTLLRNDGTITVISNTLSVISNTRALLFNLQPMYRVEKSVEMGNGLNLINYALMNRFLSRTSFGMTVLSPSFRTPSPSFRTRKHYYSIYNPCIAWRNLLRWKWFELDKLCSNEQIPRRASFGMTGTSTVISNTLSVISNTRALLFNLQPMYRVEKSVEFE